MVARKSSRVNRKYKTRYRIQNWPEYERGLRSRGDITIWFSDEAVAAGQQTAFPQWPLVPVLGTGEVDPILRTAIGQS